MSAESVSVGPVSDDVLLHARGLTKRFGDFVAVDGIDVEVRRGEAFGFLGPNGAGKSSTMRMVGCVSPVTAGDLRILGMDPASDGPAIRARLGVCPQKDILDEDLSVEENLWVYGRFFGLSRAEVRRRADELRLPGPGEGRAMDDEIGRWNEVGPRYGLQVVGPPIPA